MGKCCIRFKSLDDIPLGVVGEAFRRVPAKKYIEHYERNMRSASKAATAKAARASAARAKPAVKGRTAPKAAKKSRASAK